MAILFDAVEILKIAIEIEKNGSAFYHSRADLAKDQAVKRVYSFLAAQEERHLKMFETMLRSAEDYLPPEQYPDEEPAYIKALADDALFTAHNVAQTSAAPLASELAAIRLAIGMEKDSILLYSQLKGLVRRPQQEQVSMVVAEEKAHLTQFLELEKKLRES